MSKFSLVSADSHVVEPADLWTNRLDKRFRDRAPHVERGENGTDSFYCEGMYLLPPGGMSAAGKEMAPDGLTMDDVYPGAYDPDARLEEIAVDGVERRLDLAARFGADELIDLRRFPTPADRVRRVQELTDALDHIDKDDPNPPTGR